MRIRRERNRRGLTQIDLATLAGVVLKTLQRIEQGKVADSKDTDTLLAFLGLPYEEPDSEADDAADAVETARRLPSAVLFAEVGRRVAQIPGIEPGLGNLPTLGGDATLPTDKAPGATADDNGDKTGDQDDPPNTQSSSQ